MVVIFSTLIILVNLILGTLLLFKAFEVWSGKGEWSDFLPVFIKVASASFALSILKSLVTGSALNNELPNEAMPPVEIFQTGAFVNMVFFLLLGFVAIGCGVFFFERYKAWKKANLLTSEMANDVADSEYMEFFKQNKQLSDIENMYVHIGNLHTKMTEKLDLSAPIKQKATALRNKAHKQVGTLIEVHELYNQDVPDASLASKNDELATQVFANLEQIRNSLYVLLENKTSELTDDIFNFKALNIEENSRAVTRFNDVHNMGVKLVKRIKENEGSFQTNDVFNVKKIVTERLDELFVSYQAAKDSKIDKRGYSSPLDLITYEANTELSPEAIFMSSLDKIEDYFVKVDAGLDSDSNALEELITNQRYLDSITS